MASDISGLLPGTTNISCLPVIATDRLPELTRAISPAQSNSTQKATIFMSNCSKPYGIPSYVLTDNGRQLVSKLFTTLWPLLQVRKLISETYYLQTNGQGESSNCTIFAALRHYVSDYQRNLDMYVQPPMYAYNTQMSKATETSLGNLILPREPLSAASFGLSAGTAWNMLKLAQSRHTILWILERIEPLKVAVGRCIAAKQKRFKKGYEKKAQEPQI